MPHQSPGRRVVPASVLTSRLTGAMLLVAVLIGSLLVSRIGGARVAGTAMATPGSGAPAVGECVARIVGPPVMPVAVGPRSPVSISTVGETSVTFADCAGPHVGEVVAYQAVAATPVATAAARAGVDGAPNAGSILDASTAADRSTAAAAPTAAAVSDSQWCQLVAGTYREQNTARYGTGPDGWAPTIGPRFAAILSAPTLDPAGGRWAACALLAPGLEPYAGSYLRSLAGLPAPAPFGLCQTGRPVDWVSCVAPHRSQTFGTDGQQGLSPEDQVASCRSLIERTTGMKDVTGGGLLRVDVVGARGGNVGTPDAAAPAAVTSCRLTMVGTGDLVGTLVGIGNRPLPLA